MGRTSTEFVCQACGHRATKWSGKCPDCGEWNAFAEESAKAGNLRKPGKSRPYSQPVLPITAISPAAVHRLSTGIGELDRVLGGGLVPGSLTLIGGDPGIGKSTLVLQSLYAIARAGSCVWYVSGEESPEQIQLRATRLGCLSANLQVCSEICIEEVLRILDRNPPSVMALDSIQTFFTSDLPSAPGTISQVREVAFKVFQACKTRGVPTIIIGHITKDGAIAGPKALEHIVDTVLTFEGDPGHTYRILRAVKNRFGPTPEMGVFEMRESGLEPVTNPSELFLSERPLETPGSVVVGAMEGTRPLMVEVQALVSPSSAIGMARRMASGVDPNRVTLLVAILEKRLGMQLQGEDIFVNVAGGLKLTEPAVDLGVAAVLASSFQNRAIDAQTVFIGEVGLTGEVRSVTHPKPRVREAARLGFRRCVLPAPAGSAKFEAPTGMELAPVKTVAEALETVLS